jgi:hypothetical protein
MGRGRGDRAARGRAAAGAVLALAVVPALLLTAVACTPAGRERTGDRSAPPGSATVTTASTSSRTEQPHGAAPHRARGTRAWRLSRPAMHHEVEAYATAASAPAGRVVGLRVSTGARRYHVEAYRIGAYRGGDGHLVWRSGPQRGHRQPAACLSNVRRRTVVAPWRTSLDVDTDSWAPGLYVFKVVTGSGWQTHVPYVVRSPGSSGRTALVFPVTTWQAYNDWGGRSLYEGPVTDRRSWAVSFDRPYPAPGAVEMRFSAVPVVVAAERLDLSLAYFTNVDVARDPSALTGARSYVSVGHDEYWTASMRRHVAAARSAGTNLVFLGANTMYWRIRLEQGGRVVVGYRSDAAQDTAPRHLRTGLWREADDASPENALTGLQYECFPVDTSFTVVSPRWWGFAGTGVRRGESFAHLVGVEADRVYPVPSTPRPLEVLAHHRYSCRGVPTSTEATYYTTPSGAGVLDVGTFRWTCALVARCPQPVSRRATRFVRRVTATVLRDFARGPAARRHPAHDNVADFDLPRVNQVPAS